ncbi:erythromycin esterase family protein [Streptomyces sp. NPDC051907]|uniref:erythromycin esterase family protein n=1 Tax=Streptomyces sp. NPDC051907 TaxID=3155284 RepID=UPI00344223AC
MDSYTGLRIRRTLLLVLALALALGSLAVAAPAPARDRTGPAADDPVRALARAARPLADLRPLEQAIGTARIVGVGEATHNSREFFRFKHRLFQDLVERQGFTTFALEVNWSAGLRINDYVLHGKGDPVRIMREEFQNAYLIWNTREYLDLIRWMRQHNLRRPDRPVQFMGNDLAYAGPRLFDAVTAYADERYPALAPQIARLYRASRPTAGVDASIKAYTAKPLAERRAMAKDVRRALALLEEQRPGPDRAEHAWVLQHARAIAQTGTEFSYDFQDAGQVAEAMAYRDRSMAENTVWWQRQTGHRMLLSAHNGHVAYEASDPAGDPKPQGAVLRELVGDAYTNIGFTFGQGSFSAFDTSDPAEPLRRFEVGPPEKGSHEHTLERVARGDYYLDMRTAPPAARAWLSVARPVRSIGGWPDAPEPLALTASYDVLVHLHRITAADRL